MSLFINGLGDIQYTSITEYVSSFVSKVYIEKINHLKAILNKITASASDYDQIIDAMQDLAKLAKNGATDPQTPLARNFITLDMARALANVFRSLQSAGIDLNPTVLTNDEKIQLVKTWQSMAGFGVDELLRYSLTVNFNLDPSTLQNVVELDYVKAGNDYISGKLVDLQQALSTSKSILDSLNVIQGISNLIEIDSDFSRHFKWPPDVMDDISRDAQAFISQYNAALSAAFALDGGFGASAGATHFANEIKRQVGIAGFSPAVGDDSARFNMGRIYKVMASTHFKQIRVPLFISHPGDASTQLLLAHDNLKAKIDFLSTFLGIKRSNINSLSYFLDNVNKTIEQYHAQGNDWVSEWIKDKQDVLVTDPDFKNAGAIQTTISQAIRSTQSLNDTKKEEVRQYMYFFEQFYKSANGVLNRLTQAIEKMGRETG